ncbi:hypothetical protein SAMD00019534_111580 [Acytostelium subglobosum LB1]|uniref:hypothetical protein n=1 Tax=Acytostelium subglobosum LB1 TaxID=1410327 RepID=UPI000644B393|nr:hypothetical protein SAMD00019534_111580 [Acytostelium subglobosum LB1]GAM27982.1 hypothetical protein SAMD00019534_111580 [Acytostelium subglobosum LB1]|eukprot:XP_012748941.1 hypothetical protein SAMD00019534_111580 [Acytostelium subglobosum LB1]
MGNILLGWINVLLEHLSESPSLLSVSHRFAANDFCLPALSTYKSLGLLYSGVFGSFPAGAKGATLIYTDPVLACAGKTKARKALIDLQCLPCAPPKPSALVRLRPDRSSTK